MDDFLDAAEGPHIVDPEGPHTPTTPTIPPRSLILLMLSLLVSLLLLHGLASSGVSAQWDTDTKRGWRSRSRRLQGRRLHPSGQFILVRPDAAAVARSNKSRPLFRFAVLSDTHFWLPTPARAEFEKSSVAKPVPALALAA